MTPTDIGRIVGAVAPACATWQLRATRLWLIDSQIPFAEIDLHDHGRLVAVRFSVHCSPGWAGIVATALAREAQDLVVSDGCFVQGSDGRVYYDTDAHRYYAAHRELAPLRRLSRFSPYPH